MVSPAADGDAPALQREHFGSHSAAFNALLDAGLAAFAIVPLFLTRHLPLLDLPNHLASQYIIRDLATSRYLQQFYEVHWALVPNLGLELFVLVARNFLSIDDSVRAFCVATILLLFYGTRLINRELSGGCSRLYRIAPLFCYGGPFQFGFLSYCFGIGLALVVFGAWLRLRRRSLLLGVGVFAPLCLLLLLCHLAAFGLFAVAIGAYELAHATHDCRKDLTRAILVAEARVACFLVPPFALFVALSPTAGAAGAIRFSTLRDKAVSLAAITWFSAPRLELSLLVLAMLGFGFVLLARAVEIRREGLAILGAQAIIWLILPRVALGSGFTDYRIPWAVSFFALANMLPGPRWHSLARPFAIGFGILVLIRVSSIAFFWLSWEPTLNAIDQALQTLPLGSRLMVVGGGTGSTSRDRRPPLSVAAYAVARRQAYVPSIFASLSGQIVFFRPRFAHTWSATPSSLDSLAPEYNYVLVLRPGRAHVSSALPLACVAAGAEFRLLRVVPPQSRDRRGAC